MPNEFQASKTFQQTASATFAPTMPRYVKTDKVCLRFYGYFQESVNDSNDEISRVRPVTLYYFVVDDSIQIVEPKSNNSGMPQGALVKRHRVPKQRAGNGLSQSSVADNDVEYGPYPAWISRI